MSNTVPGMIVSLGAASAATGAGGGRSAERAQPTAAETGSWYEAMAKAWGKTLDNQAARITELSASISEGGDQPSQMVQLTAESLRMQFMSNNASTSQNSVGQALETLGKRQ
ncbi:MAG: hypothetical protein ACXIUZ_06095 [Lysobacteraceae bacterium]